MTSVANGTQEKSDDTDAVDAQTVVENYINAKFVPPADSEYASVTDPSTSAAIGRVALSGPSDVDAAVSAARDAFPAWSGLTVKARAATMLRFHALIREHAGELAELIVSENGKNMNEALADVAKGNETVEYACSLPQLAQGKIDRVSTSVTCSDRRDALGVVASICPFNFPFMVPMWTVPIALVMGNTVVLKPSEKVPLTMGRVAGLIEEAGFPPGVFNMVHGAATAVNALIDHPGVRAVTFVGSSPVAKAVKERCDALHKRCTALGGAKNHLIALPDCDVEGASSDIVVSYAGCAGQRCMAASVLLLVGPSDGSTSAPEDLLRRVVEKSSKIEPGTQPGQMGAVIDQRSHENILRYIERSEKEDGAEILLDGRGWCSRRSGGCWIGPTIIRHKKATDAAMTEEVFGPVLSVFSVSSWEEAIEIENANPFGNAASIYTTSGAHADWFLNRVRASMLGVNVGIPVPREPFSFGGLSGTRSKFGDADITGDGALEFFTNRIKITTKWPVPSAPEYTGGGSSGNGANKKAKTATDHANFAGRM